MPSIETFPALHGTDAESGKKASFELNGTSVPVEEFMTHPAEAAEVIHGAKERQEDLGEFRTHMEEAMRNIESALPTMSEERVSMQESRPESTLEPIERGSEEDDKDALLLKIASFAERVPGGKKALGALALVIGLSSLPKDAEAFSSDPIQVAQKEVERGVQSGVRKASRDTGRAIGGAVEQVVDTLRKSIGLETPQERARRENEERRAEQQLKKQHDIELRNFNREQVQRVREDTKRVTDFERANDQYQRKLEEVRRTFNQEFDRAQASYIQQRDRVGSPEQAKRYEREQWQRWLQAARTALQKLEQYDQDLDNVAPDAAEGVASSLAQRVAGAKMERSELLQSSTQMRQALSDLADKMERSLGITENVQSPLRSFKENKVSVPSRSVPARSSEEESSRIGDWDKIDPKYRF